MGISFDRSFHHFWLAKLLLSKCLHVKKRVELNDEGNTSKIETVDELIEPSRFGTMLFLNKSGHLLVTVIEVRGGGDCISARSSIKEATS